MNSEISIDFDSRPGKQEPIRRQSSQQTNGCTRKINGTPGMSY